MSAHSRSEDEESTPKVVIIGAGPAGLLLARYLLHHSLPCVIYERESSPNARDQGGSLDLHEDTGMKALRETGLLDKAEGLFRGEGAEAMKIMDESGKVWWDENGDPDSARGRPEVDR